MYCVVSKEYRERRSAEPEPEMSLLGRPGSRLKFSSDKKFDFQYIAVSAQNKKLSNKENISFGFKL